jgi:nucleoside-diphosphate-sugar epimerase
MHALVTGGGGFLGCYIAEKLRDSGASVRVFSRNSHPHLQTMQIEHIRGDVRDSAAVHEACQGMDVVFHAAALPGIWGRWSAFYSVNTVGTHNIIDACRASGVSRLVYTSSPSVVFDGTDHCSANESLTYPTRWTCHYPHSKALAEQAVLAANDAELSTVALRPHLIWGPRDNHLIPRLITRAGQGRLRQVGDGTNLVSMSYVENVADAHLQAADCLHRGSTVAGQAYFINEPQPVNLWDWITEILQRAGIPGPLPQLSAGSAHRLGAVLELIWRTLPIPGEPPMTRFLASQLSGSHYYDISNARQDFGYCPRISIAEGMHRLEPELQRLSATTTVPR